MSRLRWLGCGVYVAFFILGCGDAGPSDPRTNPDEGPPTGNGDGTCTVPAEAAEEDSSNPATVVGDGTPESCTADAFIAAVAQGGVITFDCGHRYRWRRQGDAQRRRACAHPLSEHL